MIRVRNLGFCRMDFFFVGLPTRAFQLRLINSIIARKPSKLAGEEVKVQLKKYMHRVSINAKTIIVAWRSLVTRNMDSDNLN